jgi:hypothetical protein
VPKMLRTNALKVEETRMRTIRRIDYGNARYYLFQELSQTRLLARKLNIILCVCNFTSCLILCRCERDLLL